VFVHGCFWHRHSGCRYTTTPETRPEFWLSKFRQNTARDARTMAELGERGWRVAVIWECALRGDRAAKATSELSEWLIGSEPLFETEPIA
jgi:DNA mismatch endonuclease (patch repair protein)